MRYAHGIVSDYLIPEISDKLLERLNLPSLEVASKKRKNSDIDPEEIKKLKKECAEKETHSKYFNEDKKKEKVRYFQNLNLEKLVLFQYLFFHF